MQVVDVRNGSDYYYYLFLESRKKLLLKRALKAIIKRSATSDNEFSSNNEKNDEENRGVNSDLQDLLELLDYLSKYHRQILIAADDFSQNSNLTSTHLDDKAPKQHGDSEFVLPVALVQLLVIVLVFLIGLFMCKCNQMMEACRNCRKKNTQQQQLDEDRYHDKMTIRDYFCFMWYNFKKRRRFNRRRKRRLKNLKNARHRRESKESRTSRKNSLIFKRRSVIYRNNRKNTAGSSNKVVLSNVDSFNSAQSLKRSVKFRPNTGSSQVAQPAPTSFAETVSSIGDDTNMDVLRLKKNISIYFEKQSEELV